MTDDDRAALTKRRDELMQRAKVLRTEILEIEGRWQNARCQTPADAERRQLEEIESEIKAIDERLG
jgi:hypothetical protein